ncbi:class I SAM-dependent methyltransferase [Halomonas sp. MCCC 1A11036]|jgi:2-polyprenyl-3-methyl-5-hydroxy-6-metoxy-1,4-benzoquinol methylase|uniref:Class I SAM-dependent methyltransferase n=1 Tax=Billgrantia zhangzhouensis TaxID=2733481 RepID=A0ABS9AFE7_9GAMM|nr:MULTISPECIES: class I SAM-dependent methyltransferase [Halomonas]MCE8020450.1 class I SAM-dependent methyltransferase [Halomonas zhangzhouensis]MCE8033287.1 class I SAM-dependent methyltransferase [Halomonas sp. MCCC 1A11057]
MTAHANASVAFDTDRAADFENRFVHALNEGAMLQLISLAHRSGLLAQLADGEPVTSSELAVKTGLDERYVREWLGGATVAALVEHDPRTMTYRLPPEHAALLTDGGEANLAVFAQYLPLMGQVEDDVLECFRHGGGVPYTRYTRFHEVMAEDSGQTVLPVLFDAILPLAPELPERLVQGIDVLDLGCGRGLALMKLAERFPASRFTGYDLSKEAIGWATQRAARLGLGNLHFEQRDLSDFDRTAPAQHYDLVTTFDAIHDQAHPLNLLKGIRRTLREDGVYLAQDIHASSHHHGDREHPMGTLLYTVSIMHCMSVSLAQGGEGLGTMWGREKAREYFGKAGFGSIEVHQLPHDIQNDYWVLRP